jgi:hypothetical protein
LVLTLGASAASAQMNLGFKGVGVRVGYVEPENIDGTFAFGVFTDLGTFHPNVSFETYLDYWSKSMDAGSFGETSFRDIVLGAKVEYMFALASPTVRPFVGAGLSLHFLHGEASIADMTYGSLTIPGTTIDSSDTKLGLDFGGGVRAGVSETVDIIGEAKFSLVSDINQFGISAGVLFHI